MSFTQEYFDQQLLQACFRGDLDSVKIFLTPNNLGEFANIAFRNHRALFLSCSHGYLEIVKYLLSSNDLKDNSDINADDMKALESAFQFNHEEVSDYILTSNNLKYPIDFNTYGNLIFYNICRPNKICKPNKIDIIKHLILEKNLFKTSNIVDILKNTDANFRKEVLFLFKLRDIQKEKTLFSNRFISNSIEKAEKNIIKI